MHKLSIGIEHLFTGIQLREQDLVDDRTFTFQQESPTIVRVLNAGPFQAYWPCKQSFLSSVECTPEEEKEYTGPKHQYSQGEAEWLIARVLPRVNEAHSSANTARQHNAPLRRMKNQPVYLPEVVVKALRRKYGAESDSIAVRLLWDGLMKCWTYTHNGIFYGVEEDGYIHT